MIRTLSKLWILQPSTRRDRLLLTLPFYGLYLVLLVRHVVWRDEINAWAISFVSTNLGDLLHRVHYEAHPAMWYLLLFAGGRITHAVWMLKLIQGLIGTGIYAYFAWNAPLRRLEYLLILLSYYFTFEYTILARMYGLEVLFAMIYIRNRIQHPERVLRNTLWIFLIANVDITASILAGGLLLEYWASMLSETTAPRTEFIRHKILPSFALFVLAMATCIGTLWPAKDIGWNATGKIFSHFWEAGHLVQAAIKWIALPWIPMPINIVVSWDTEDWPYFFAMGAIAILLYLIYRPHWKQMIMVVSMLIAGIFFSHATGVAGVRHTGTIFLATLLSLWIWRAKGENVSPLLYILLIMIAVPGGIAIADQFRAPYTDGDATADWIREHHLEHMMIFGSLDTNMLGVPQRLDLPYYQLNGQVLSRVLTFNRQRDDYDPLTELSPRLIAGMHKEHVHQALLIDIVALTRQQQQQLQHAGFHQQLLVKFDRGFVGDEYSFVYLIQDETRP
ncbi:MAG: hypothetical protein PW735_00565 [Acidobacteriaceae bacterium]|nr:hypothetical protein [Acidobacteriaceae bacterium]